MGIKEEAQVNILEEKYKCIIEKKNITINQLKDGIVDYQEQLKKKQDLITELEEEIGVISDANGRLSAMVRESKSSLDIPKMEAELWAGLVKDGKLPASADKLVKEFLKRFGPDKEVLEEEVLDKCPHPTDMIRQYAHKLPECLNCGEIGV